MKHQAYHHEHPTMTLALNTRTRLLGTLNIAVALRGRSCGWGSCDRPRRWFVGHHTVNRAGGRHFARLVLDRGRAFAQGSTSRVLAQVGATR